MPFTVLFAFEGTFVATLLFPIAGVVADLWRTGQVQPAWGWGIGAMFACLALTTALTYSPVGDAIYAAVTAGTQRASRPGLDFWPPPPGLHSDRGCDCANGTMLPFRMPR